MALMVKIMAVAMAGTTLGVDARPFSGTKGGPPRTGQFFFAVDPCATSGGRFSKSINALVVEFRDQPGARIQAAGAVQPKTVLELKA